jgi:Lrp/AsnC family transcriptional regulator for asnA, asnC and gidA
MRLSKFCVACSPKLGRGSNRGLHGDAQWEASVARNLSPKGASPKGVSSRGPDDTDKALITALQRNGRESYAALAKVVGLSESAVRQRVQRLLDDGVVQIVGVTDPMVMGFARWAMIGIVVEGDVRKVSDQLAAIDAIDYVVLTAGSFDLLVEVVCEDDDSLLALLNDHIRSIPSVRSTETFMYLKLAKQTYAWGAR